ncbi:hypothetical protein BK022_00345 [Methylorubrum extorquens]|uniref:Uncharacterized protein n=1 Tax=Methylorubrum extorquens TaxID=408 RepID=A0A1S1PB76_METEX|nr:hypothetical protein BK022_00345 [Methylorubrum extorquens]
MDVRLPLAIGTKERIAAVLREREERTAFIREAIEREIERRAVDQCVERLDRTPRVESAMGEVALMSAEVDLTAFVDALERMGILEKFYARWEESRAAHERIEQRMRSDPSYILNIGIHEPERIHPKEFLKLSPLEFMHLFKTAVRHEAKARADDRLRWRGAVAGLEGLILNTLETTAKSGSTSLFKP